MLENKEYQERELLARCSKTHKTNRGAVSTSSSGGVVSKMLDNA